MNIAAFSIKNRLLSIIVIMLTLAGGWSAYQTMPRFEDPEFIIRTAVIYTQYPGANPHEVAQEVTEPLETALQQLQEVEAVRSTSSDGVSEIQVDIKYEFSTTSSALQLIWSKVRNKVKDSERNLPPGASTPIVNDDFGDVYGFYYFLTGEGYTPAELRQYITSLQKELLSVKGVAKVALVGTQQEAIFIEISEETAARLGVSVSNIYNILSQQNAVVAAGHVLISNQRLVINPSGAIDSVNSIKNLLISTATDGKIIYLKDIANIWRGYQTPASQIVRYNGKAAIALGISNVSGANVVSIGQAIDQQIRQSESRRPLGMELHEFYHQATVVDTSVQTFVINVIIALIIVIVTLLIFMGLRSSLVIGTILLLTISATLATMNIADIPMHRISLGALIIALGMMVDNAIVITEGILVGIQQGQKKLDIAKKIVAQSQWPLLGGTLVGIIAFAPIGFAPGSTAEYTGHLFWVILIALMFSWIFALTLTPLFCVWLFRENTTINANDNQTTGLLAYYKKMIILALKYRWFVIVSIVTLFVISAWGFQFVKSGFFPASTTPQVVIDYWLPQGTSIERTEQDMIVLEDFVRQQTAVNAAQTMIGGGGLRYLLVYGPESSNSAYGQIIARLDDYRQIDALIPTIQSFIDENFPDAQGKVWRFVLGPGGGSKIEAVFRGSDPRVLRHLANQAKDIMAADGKALSIKDDWRQPTRVVQPIYSETTGRRAGVSREDLANALLTHYSGKQIGTYRENDQLIPIISRPPLSGSSRIGDIKNLQIPSSATGLSVPIAQVTDGFRTIWRDGQLRRKNRIWMIKAQSDPHPNELTADLFNRLRPPIEAIELPDGYTLEWKGEYGNSQESSNNLASTIPLGLLAMILVVCILFGTIRQPIIIWLVVPLALIGVVCGLLITNTPMEFMAILGLLSLSGLLIKNAIVLVDQMDVEIRQGKARFDAVVDSATSRVRPVMMGTLTTVLGVIPLYFDAFFQSMAVVIVFGLTFATLLTLLIIPIFYAIFMVIDNQESHHYVNQ